MILCYNKPADMSYLGWEKQALPLGNGKIGVKVFGGESCELIHFNEKTLWSGGKDVPGYNGGISNPDKGAGMREIQTLLSDGSSGSKPSASVRFFFVRPWLFFVFTSRKFSPAFR